MSDILITLTSPPTSSYLSGAIPVKPIRALALNGAVIRYGINAVPTAVVSLANPADQLLRDFESIRRAPVRLVVQHSDGQRIVFDGLLDAISFSQHYGDYRVQLIIKSPFQLLNEINPMMLGFHAASADIAKRLSVTKSYNPTLEDAMQAEILRRVFVGGNSVIEGALEVFKLMLDSQRDRLLVQDTIGTDSVAAIEAANAIRESHLVMAQDLLSRIEVAVDTEMTMSDSYTLDFILTAITSARNSLLDSMLFLINNLGCALVFANDRAFIVPNTGFIQMPHRPIAFSEVSGIPNVYYPAQYTSVMFNDNGYKDIRGVYTMADATNLQGVDGLYVDEVSGGTGGITTTVLPFVFSNAMSSLRAVQRSKVTKRVADRTRPILNTEEGEASTTEEDGLTRVQTLKNLGAEATEDLARLTRQADDLLYAKQKQMCETWAQLQYYQLKYSDRVGSVSGIFNGNTAPGAVGSVYVRSSNLFIDFFVTDVSHNFRKDGNAGEATTTLNFNCGRAGYVGSDSLSIGLPNLSFFRGFDVNSSVNIARRFVTNIYGSAN